MRLGRQGGVDAQGDRGRPAEGAGHAGQGVQLRLALHVEEPHAALQAVAHLLVGLAHAGEDDLITPSSGGQGAVELAAARHVEARAGAGHEPAEAQVRVGFDAIADERLNRGKRLLQLV